MCVCVCVCVCVCERERNLTSVPLEDVGGLWPHIIAPPQWISGSATRYREWIYISLLQHF